MATKKKATTTTPAPEDEGVRGGAPEGEVPVAGTPDASTETDEIKAPASDNENEEDTTITPGEFSPEGDDGSVSVEGDLEGGEAVPPQYEIHNAATGHRTRATMHDFKQQFRREGYELVGEPRNRKRG